MNGYLCQLKGTNDDRRVNSPCLAFEYECKLLFLRMGLVLLLPTAKEVLPASHS